MFKERKSLNLSEISKEIGLFFWKKNNTFYKSVNNRPDSKRFVFFEVHPLQMENLEFTILWPG